MTSESRDTVLERNVGRMVRRWADPLSPGQVDGACRDFLKMLVVPPKAPRRAPFAGRLGIAAALLLCAMTFWLIVR